jgi:U3 small nucleolar ribonucleoprotein protein IMP4
MLRKNARLRREFLYSRSLQAEERERLDRKIRIREALEKGTPLHDKDLEAEAKEKEYGVAETVNNTPENNKTEMLDNEYANAGAQDPKILLTSSHEPSDSMNRFLKELRYLFPNCQRVNRGSQQLSTLVGAAVRNGFSDLIVVHESRGTPDGLTVCHLPHGPTAYFTLYNVVMRHDVFANEDASNMPQVYPHLIFHNFKTQLGNRVATILKYLFPIPKQDTKRVLTFANQNDFISFRHHTYTRPGKSDDKTKVLLKEIGPRFEMMCYQIKLGTLDMKDAETEWVLRNNMRTAKKRQALGVSKDQLLTEEKERFEAMQ